MTKTKSDLSIGAVLIIAILIAGSIFITQPTGVLSIDVNPSIELSFNRMERVVKAKGFNPEAIALLEGNELKGLDIDDAVKQIIFALLDKGFLSQEEAILLFSNDGRDGSNKVLERIMNETVVWLKANRQNTNLVRQSINMAAIEIELAHKLGMSAGKYNLIKTVLESDLGISSDLIMELSISELILLAQENNINLNMISFDDWDEILDSSSYIGADQALEIALDHAGIDVSAAFDMDIDLEKDDGHVIYDVEFKTNTMAYEYEVDALTGEIIEWDHDPIDMNDDLDDELEEDLESSAYVGADQALEIALLHAGIDASTAFDMDVDLERDDGRVIYDVEFKAGTMAYEYEIDALTGEIIEWDHDPIDMNDDLDEELEEDLESSAYIGADQALEIALLHAGIVVSAAFDMDIDLEKDDGRVIYDVEFKAGTMEYEYEIDALTGEILEWDHDSIDMNDDYDNDFNDDDEDDFEDHNDDDNFDDDEDDDDNEDDDDDDEDDYDEDDD